jgi:hypothetical protein
MPQGADLDLVDDLDLRHGRNGRRKQPTGGESG